MGGETTIMASEFGELKYIHEVPEFTEATIALLNSEWPRKGSAWELSLSRSNPNFPVIMICVKDGQVVSHLRVTKVSDDEHGILVENVVVDRALRGKGYGRFLMTAVENFARERGFTTIYLSTPDQQGFYARLGFVEGEPVSSLGENASRLNKAQLSGLLAAFGGNAAATSKDKTWMRKHLS